MASSKCSKPVGEYCRLHNPAPSGQHFSNVADVFAAISREDEQRRVKKVTFSSPSNVTDVSFQGVDEMRTLPSDIPQSISDHIAKNSEEMEHLSEVERKALLGYTGFAAGVCNTVLLGEKYEYYDDAPLWRESDAPCDFVNREDLVDYMETIDTVLASRQEERRIIYRGIPIYRELHDEIGAAVGKTLDISDTDGLVEGLKEYYKVGKVFNFNTYLSTSTSAHYAAERTENTAGTKADYYKKPAEIQGIQFELKTNAGVDVTSIARRHHASEREVILPRDTYFKVSNVFVQPKSYDTTSGYDRKPDRLEKETYTSIAAVVQLVEVDVDGNEIISSVPRQSPKSIEEIVPQ